MSRPFRRTVLAAFTTTTLLAVEVWRRGFGAPLAFGIRLWLRACDPRPETEADPI